MKFTEKKEIKLLHIDKLIMYIILAICIIPVLVATFYGVPAADDFTNTLPYLSYEGSMVSYLFENLVNVYKGWQGTYFGAFFTGIPIYHFGGIFAVRVVMFFNAVFFFATLTVCVISLIDGLEMSKDADGLAKLSFITMVIFYIINMGNIGESFYWITGLWVYTVPLSFALFCITAYLKYGINNRSRKWLIVGILSAFCGAGGALNISAFMCAVLLLCIAYDCLIKKKVKANVLIGLTAFIGALINTMAPGNYARHGVIDTEIRFEEMFVDTFSRVNSIIKNDFERGILPVIIVIGFILVYDKVIDSKFEFKYPLLVTLYCYMGIYLTIFPVALGYSSATKFPDRCLFVERISTIIFVLIATVYWSGWFAKKRVFKIKFPKIIFTILICIIGLFVCIRNDSYRTFTSYRMIKHLVRGDFLVEKERQESILEQILNAEEENVTVYIDTSEDDFWTNLKKIGVSEDENWWVNDGLEMYYDKKSIVLLNRNSLKEN